MFLLAIFDKLVNYRLIGSISNIVMF